MPKRTKKQRTATAFGAVLAILTLVIGFAVVSSVDARGSSILDAQGEIITTAPVVWSLTDSADVLTVELAAGGSCDPASSAPLSSDFLNGTATVGLGLNVTMGPLQDCGGSGGLNFMYVTTTLTAADVLALNPAVFGFSWESAAVNSTASVPGGWYLIPPPGTQNALAFAFVCTSCDSPTVTNNATKYLPLEADAIATLQGLPTWYFGFGFDQQQGITTFADFGDDLIIDGTWYGANITGLQGSGFSVFDIMPPAQILNAGVWLMAALGFFATVWLWPTSDMGTIHRTAKKRGGRK